MRQLGFAIFVILAATLSLLSGSPAQAKGHEPLGEAGPLFGVNFADKDLGGPGGNGEQSLLIGLRVARRVSPRWNWFADGTYTQSGTTLLEDVKVIEGRLGFERLFPLSQGAANFFLAGALGGADVNNPSGLEDFGRPLASIGAGFAQSGHGWRAEARVGDLLGNRGLNGADIANVQLIVGYTFGLYALEDRDSDGDGVTDSKDRCPNTPKGAFVDANGCPHDSDGDGVWDGIDQCPNTPRGVEVDSKGCPIKKALFEPNKRKLVLEGVNFEFNSAKLTSDSYMVLDRKISDQRIYPAIDIFLSGTRREELLLQAWELEKINL
ncbi:MAG TPA: thrombospondin type 3 repeat-containing protein, partial [Candidatus Eisenbacteria bacterium]|nr:thrombospondin type 3 repeat-containing protein [Candidatus Eisenbacteria bacterium]